MGQAARLAVILAAGMGTRLRDTGHMLPKGFLRLGERPIIEEQLCKLRAAGVERVVIVTGYMSEKYHELALRWDGFVETVHNPEYADSGSMYSLYRARGMIDEDFILLESDLVYEKRALDILQDFEGDNCLLVSGPTHAGDEVYVRGRNGLLIDMSKTLRTRDDIVGEFVGISRISSRLFALMVEMAERAFEKTLHVNYEDDCLVEAAKKMDIHILLVKDLVWGEVDDSAHLERVRNHIYPSIASKENMK